MFVTLQKPKATLVFKDGKRPIDYVLSYIPEDDEEEKQTKRHRFEIGLEEAGLELEHEPKEV